MDAPDGGSGQPTRTTRRRRSTSAAGRSSAGSDERTPVSSGTSSTTNPLGIESEDWTPPDQPVPADTEPDEPYLPASAEPIDWTPERAGAIVRAGGFMLHTADGMSREPGGEELWRATESDVDAIAPPLSRILNRYEPARRLAGVSDETELAFGLIGYARKNLAERGRVVAAKREREESTVAAEAEAWPQSE